MFNPLDKENLGKSVADALVAGPAQSLGSLESFPGSGIYAIYYVGSEPVYAPIRGTDTPVYVGKAITAGGRKGLSEPLTTGSSLFRRLRQHTESIKKTDLSIEHFLVRFLIVDDIWIPLGESLLIARFGPVWNTLVDGFGNHDPGSGRYQGLCPRWDVVHPGREWAAKLRPRDETAEQIKREIIQYFGNRGL